MKMTTAEILEKLPYDNPFLFVDSIVSVSDQEIEGKYTFRKDLFFYEGHFKGNPVTPGVLLTECMAQIGLVCFGIYLRSEENVSSTAQLQVALTTTDIEFLHPVLPEETVTVISEKVYFRFNKLKCKVRMLNQQGTTVCKGIITGMLIPKANE